MFLIPDEDGTEFEKEITEALERLNVSFTADKLSKVPLTCCQPVIHKTIKWKQGGCYVYNGVSTLQQACKSACSQITDMTYPEKEEEEKESEDDVKNTVSVEVCGYSGKRFTCFSSS